MLRGVYPSSGFPEPLVPSLPLSLSSRVGERKLCLAEDGGSSRGQQMQRPPRLSMRLPGKVISGDPALPGDLPLLLPLAVTVHLPLGTPALIPGLLKADQPLGMWRGGQRQSCTQVRRQAGGLLTGRGILKGRKEAGKSSGRGRVVRSSRQRVADGAIGRMQPGFKFCLCPQMPG